MTDMVTTPTVETRGLSADRIVIEHLNFCRGSAIKYIWRAGLKEQKNDTQI